MTSGIRKLPPAPMLAALIRFGFTVTDIAERFDVGKSNVSEQARRLGIPPMPHAACGALKRGRNGAKPASRYFG